MSSNYREQCSPGGEYDLEGEGKALSRRLVRELFIVIQARQENTCHIPEASLGARI